MLNNNSRIKIGKGKLFDNPGITASVTGTHAITRISLSSSEGHQASIRSLCTKSMGAIQNGVIHREDTLFYVTPANGNVVVGHGIQGGAHGTLDYERNRDYGIMIKGQDSGIPPYHDTGHMRIHLSDVNEPPLFKSNCVHNNFMACYSINEASNIIGPYKNNGVWSKLQVYDVDNDWDYVWSGHWPSNEDMANGMQNWVENGGSIQKEFDKVSSCSAIRGYQYIYNNSAPEGKVWPVQYRSCSLKEGASHQAVR